MVQPSVLFSVSQLAQPKIPLPQLQGEQSLYPHQKGLLPASVYWEERNQGSRRQMPPMLPPATVTCALHRQRGGPGWAPGLTTL